MSPTSLYPLVAGASLLLALWQPAEADIRLVDESAKRPLLSTQPECAGHRTDAGVAHQEQRWAHRSDQRKLAGGNAS